MKREDVYGLVGEPGPRPVGNWDASYYLGPDPSCVDSTWLVLQFGGDGRVAEALIVQD